MKTFKAIILAAFILSGCNQAYKVDVPDFLVNIEKTTFKVGEPVNFIINSDSDFVSFYSGEFGNDYNYRDIERHTPAALRLSLDIKQTTSGNSRLLNPRIIPVSWSSDYNGEGTVDAMEEATWNDVTDDFTFPAEGYKVGSANGSVTTSNKDIDIERYFIDQEKPIYLCFKYDVAKFESEINTGRTTVTLSNFFINGHMDNGTIPVYGIKDIDWQFIKPESWNGATDRCSLPGAQATLTMSCEWNTKQDRQLYAIAGPIYKAEDVNSGIEPGVCIKSLADPDLRSYTHTYMSPGEYEAVFVAKNSSVYGKAETVRTVKVTIREENGGIIPPDAVDWLNQ